MAFECFIRLHDRRFPGRRFNPAETAARRLIFYVSCPVRRLGERGNCGLQGGFAVGFFAESRNGSFAEWPSVPRVSRQSRQTYTKARRRHSA